MARRPRGTKVRRPEDVEIDRHIGQRVRERRVVLGLSQTALADGLGITFQQVQKYEKGFNRISAGRLYGCAELLGVPPARMEEPQQGRRRGLGVALLWSY